MNILVVKLSAIGDVIHTLPAVCAIKRRFPHAAITWLVETDAVPLLEGHPALDRVLVCKRKEWLKGMGTDNPDYLVQQIRNFVKCLRDTFYDYVIDFQGLLKSGIWVFLARGKVKLGFGRGMEHAEESWIFLNTRIPAVSMEIHALDRYMLLAKAVGAFTDIVEYRISLTDRDHMQANALVSGFRGKGPLIAINPVAKWETKMWTVEGFVRVIERITDTLDARILLTGSPADRAYTQKILCRLKENTKTRVRDIAGKTSLRELAALYRKTEILVSTDTGPMHLGAAMGTPVVAIFGPTAANRTGPCGKAHRVVKADMECAPCFMRKCSTRVCMERITPEMVFNTVLEVLGK